MTRRPDDDPKTRAPGQTSDIQALSPAESQRRQRQPLDSPTLTQLLELSLILSAPAGVDTVADEVMRALATLAPGIAIGLCLNDESSHGQVLRRYVPDDWDAASGRDPTRLFPELTEERVLNIDRLGNSTLHLAAARLPPESERLWTIMEYVRRAIEQALARQSEIDRTRKDATELRRLQAQVIQAEKLASLGQIAAGIVHELNNPLTSIIAYSEFLRRNAATREDADALERLGRIQEGAERILKFSRDLVSYARPATDVPGPVHLGEVLDKALVFCEHEFAERQVVAKLNCARPTLLVRGVAGQLTQVFVNLLTNAAHAMRNSGGSLELSWSLAPDSSQVIVEVVDVGEGIPPQDLERIFDPFFTTKAPGEGTGLGLSIVRSILEAHGGSMSAHANRQSPGTTFRVVLPVVERPSSRPPIP